MLDIEKAKKLLKSSADVQYYRGNAIITTLIFGILAALVTCIIILTKDAIFCIALLPTVGIGVPYLAWCVFNLVHIFKKVDCYTFYEVSLTHPQTSWGRRLYFTVTVEGCQMETRAIFNAQGLLTPEFNEYCNQQALVGYNAETQELVVIKERN